MNHPGLDKPNSSVAKAIGRPVEGEKEAEEIEQVSQDHSLWWFRFPLIAGTFGPMATVFSICGLTVPWRVAISSGGTEEHWYYIDNPKWMICINAIQLILALLSNLFLYLNMARRIRFSVAQAIAIIGWYASSIALTILTTIAVKIFRHESPPDYEFTQAFYYTIFSTGLYFIIATMMMVTVVGHYKSHYDKELKLTLNQRTLILQTIVFLVYLLLGAAVFAHIEDWEYLDAFYWADCSILTIGLGDYTLVTNLGRALLFPFAIGGIIVLGLIISSIRSLVQDRGNLMSARMQQKLLKKAQKQIQDSLTERQRLKQEFELIRQAQDNAAKKRRWIALLISGSVWFILWLVSAAVFRATENAQSWTYFDSVYFAYICLLTIGYGDFYPQSSFGKAFFVFWSLLAVPSLTILISNMGDTVAKEIKDVTLFLGELTILPGEGGVKTTMKRTAIKFTKRKTFGKRTREAPSNVLGQENHSVRMSQNLHAGSASDAPLDLISQGGRVGEKGEPKVLPKSRKDLHCLLIKEILTVMKHVNNSPHRKYTFEEWEWYLKLLRQDGFEKYAHGITLGRQKFDRENRNAVACECGDGIGQEANGGRKSSWVGNRSLLVCNKDEPQWILERLTKMLERELESVRREELEQNDDTGRIWNVSMNNI